MENRLKVIDEEKRGTGRTLRLIFRALSYAGEREIVYVVFANFTHAAVMQNQMIDIAIDFNIPFESKKGNLFIDNTEYRFCGESPWANEPVLRATILFDHYALEAMESRRG